MINEFELKIEECKMQTVTSTLVEPKYFTRQMIKLSILNYNIISGKFY